MGKFRRGAVPASVGSVIQVMLGGVPATRPKGGEQVLWHVLNHYISHYHQERPHQGKGNILLFPSARVNQGPEGSIQCRERLGGLLKYYHRKAA
jgi:hypothetical protein